MDTSVVYDAPFTSDRWTFLKAQEHPSCIPSYVQRNKTKSKEERAEIIESMRLVDKLLCTTWAI